MDTKKAYDIINCIGGICATKKEVKEAYQVIKDNLLDKRNGLIFTKNILNDEIAKIDYELEKLRGKC